MKHQVLLINDLAGYGKVALSAMMPILTHMGFNLYNLPTALVSNTLDYGKFDILETYDYMKNTLQVWEELGFHFDAISTGFIVTEKQAALISEYCSKQSKLGTAIFCDPIMGDEGKLYNGVSEETIQNMRKLCASSDYMVPNYTEACFLADVACEMEHVSKDAIFNIILKLRQMGAKSVIITSIPLADGNVVMGYDDARGEYFTLPFEMIPVRFPGTGDIFSALMMGEVLKGTPLEESVQKAMDIVWKLIDKNKENVDKFKGIPLESCLEVLDE